MAMAQSCETAFQLVLGRQTGIGYAVVKDFCLGIEIVAHL